MVALTGTRRTHIPHVRGDATRVAALVLLLVLATGLSVTNLTHGWIASLPYHDHLLLAAKVLGASRHTHHGDALDHAQRALRSVEPAPAQDQTREDGVVSLRPMSAQPELNSFTASGWVGGGGLPVPPAAGLLAFLVVLVLAAGIRAAPPSPPPRPA